MSAVIGLLSLLTAISAVTLWLSHRATMAYFRAPVDPDLPDPLPSVAILKPVEGAGPETYDAFATFCRLDWPAHYELWIGTIRDDDPIVEVVERLQADFPERDIKLVFAELRGTNRKTSIMEALWRQTNADLLFFSDADVRVEPDYLDRLVPRLCAEGVGCLTCLPRGFGAETAGGRMIALHYAFEYLPQWMLARQTTGIEWAIGHTMAVPRAILEELNGFTGFYDHLADDYELGNRTAKLGKLVVVPPVLLDCAMPRESFRAAFRRLLRWKRTMRRARGAQFAGVAFTYPVFWAAVLTLTCYDVAWAWGTLGIVLALRMILAELLARRIELPDWPRMRWLLPVVDLLEGVTFVGAYTGNTIVWAGRKFRLRADGTLELLDGASSGNGSDGSV